jgi:hypothetical protein
VHVETEWINGQPGPHWIIEGANVHVRSGLGQTYPRICPAGRPGGCISNNHLGNLIVGYNEVSPSRPPFRPGMHNLVVGPEHDYYGNGGFVAGSRNSLGGRSASITGGQDNEVLGFHSSVSGGHGNVASGSWSVVSGGEDRDALGAANWVAGDLFEPN